MKAIVKVELEDDPKSVFTKVIYKVLKDLKFRLTVVKSAEFAYFEIKDYKTDIIDLDLHNFYLLYSSIVKFSLEMDNSVPIKNKNAEKEEHKENFFSKTLPYNFGKNKNDFQNKRSSQSKTDEDTFCTICMEKEIQIVLPCLVIYFSLFLKFSMASAKSAALTGIPKRTRMNAQFVEIN